MCTVKYNRVFIIAALVTTVLRVTNYTYTTQTLLK